MAKNLQNQFSPIQTKSVTWELNPVLNCLKIIRKAYFLKNSHGLRF